MSAVDPWDDEGGYDQWKLDRAEAAADDPWRGRPEMPDPPDDEAF